MTFYDRLVAATSDARAEFVSLPIIGQALHGDVPRALYLDFLAQAYHHVRHTCPLLALAGWFYVFLSPAAEPGGWKFIVYALGTVSTGVLAYFIMARKQGFWPFAEMAEPSPASRT